MPGFKELGVSELLCTLLQGQGIVKPTPVQQEAIPPLVQGLDVIARAKTYREDIGFLAANYGQDPHGASLSAGANYGSNT